MDTRRIVIAMLFALAISGGGTYFLYNRLSGQAASRPTMKKVVASARAAGAGMALKADDLTMIDWPTSVPLTESFSKVDEVVGRTLLYPLGEKEPVLERDLAAVGAGIALSAKIPPGMRATSVRSNEVVGVAGFLFPGSHVDVLATYRPPGSDTPITQTVLQDVEVLTAGQKIQPDPQGKPETVNVVTLLLNPEDSEKLLLVSAQATIQFDLRSGADKEKPDTRPVGMDELVTGMKKPPAAAKPVKSKVVAEAPPKPKPPDFYSVEVIQGEKRSVEKFE